ncbi:MAG: hypothetical protein ACJ786_20165 [Catenulispora sp.]
MEWERTKLETIREYKIPEGSVPDLQDDSQGRRYVARPTRVKLRQQYQTNLVRGAVVAGPQIRRDGGFNQRSGAEILCGHTRWYDATPPEWLDKLLADEGLEWQRD